MISGMSGRVKSFKLCHDASALTDLRQCYGASLTAQSPGCGQQLKRSNRRKGRGKDMDSRRQHYGFCRDDEEMTGGIFMARLAAKARCNYYPLPDREAELIRSCLTFPYRQFSALDPCAGEGRAMAVITASSAAVRYVSAGIKGQQFRRFCSQRKPPSARTRYRLYMRF